MTDEQWQEEHEDCPGHCPGHFGYSRRYCQVVKELCVEDNCPFAYFIKKLAKNMKDLNSEFSAAVDKHFWELI